MNRIARNLLLSAVAVAATSAFAQNQPIIGLITKTDTNPFFVKMKEGAEAKAAELGVTLKSYAGKVDGDHESQVAAIEACVADGAKGILITASDTKAKIDATLARLADAGIATLSVEGILHGQRRGDSDSDGLVENLPQDQLIFNLRNPDAARDNPLQAAIDQAYEAKLIGKDNVNGWPFDLYIAHGAGALANWPVDGQDQLGVDFSAVTAADVTVPSITGLPALDAARFTAAIHTRYTELPTHSLNILVGMILATIKATLVALIFMHLNHERSMIYKILLFTVVLAAVLFALFIFSHEDPLQFKGFYAPVEQQ